MNRNLLLRQHYANLKRNENLEKNEIVENEIVENEIVEDKNENLDDISININIFIVCYNESVLLPHTIAHYKKNFPSCQIFIYDNYSTDDSVKIAESLGCKVIMWDTENILNDYKLRDLKNTCWKNIESGWIIVIDMDEWLSITERELKKETKLGTTILNIKGIDMIGESLRVNLSDINLNNINKYVDNQWENKKLCFLREKINDINYDLGSHTCNPNGEIKYSSKTYYNKHMCNLGLPFLTNKMLHRYKRSEEMRKLGIATHYINNINEIKNNYNNLLIQSKIL